MKNFLTLALLLNIGFAFWAVAAPDENQNQTQSIETTPSPSSSVNCEHQIIIYEDRIADLEEKLDRYIDDKAALRNVIKIILDLVQKHYDQEENYEK